MYLQTLKINEVLQAYHTIFKAANMNLSLFPKFAENVTTI